MTSKAAQQVREFHEVFGSDISDTPTSGTAALRELRFDLLAEELDELYGALGEPGSLGGSGAPNLVEMADALGDILYVTYGAAIAFGIDLDAVVDEIHRSNMSKLGADGKPIYREDGKVLKGLDYSPPNLAAVIYGEEMA